MATSNRHVYDFILVSKNETELFKRRIADFHQHITKFLVLDTTGDFYTANWETIKQHTDQIIPVHLSTTDYPTKAQQLSEGLKKGVREILSEIQEDDLIIISDVGELPPTEAVTYLLEPSVKLEGPQGINDAGAMKAVVVSIGDLIRYPNPADIFSQSIIPLDYPEPSSDVSSATTSPTPARSTTASSTSTDTATTTEVTPEVIEGSNYTTQIPIKSEMDLPSHFPRSVGEPPKTCQEIFMNNVNRGCSKVTYNFKVYERYLRPFYGRKPVIVEIGVAAGGSLNMWNTYFGGECEIWGIDVDERCKRFEKDNIHILIGDQSDEGFLREVEQRVPSPDIIIDDGGHHAKQQVSSFNFLFQHLKIGGVYMIENAQTSYFKAYEGGLRKSGTIVEEIKNLVDQMNAWSTLSTSYEARSNSEEFQVDGLTRTVAGISFYPCMIVVEKDQIDEPKQIKSGMEFLWGTRPTSDLVIKRMN